MAQDSLIPFMIHDQPIRGRVVRLGSVVNDILSRHHYPDAVSQLLAETLVVAAILSSSLKHEGVFTIQVQSKGAISLLVVDASFGGALRGYAQFDAQAIASCSKDSSLHDLFGDGFLAITLDAGAGAQRYQGVVPLEGKTIGEAVQRYFSQSMQMDMQITLAVGIVSELQTKRQRWIAGGIYVEKMPEIDASDGDAWLRAKTLMLTARDDELLDESLEMAVLLHRLFHEDGVWVYDAQPMVDQCRCSREKIGKTLSGMGAEAIAQMMVDDRIEVTCQFCNRSEVFVESDIKQ